MLTAEQIDAALQRARRAVGPLALNCMALPDSPNLAQQSETDDGWQKIDWIVSETGRYAWDAWHCAERDEGRAKVRPWGGDEDCSRSATENTMSWLSHDGDHAVRDGCAVSATDTISIE